MKFSAALPPFLMKQEGLSLKAYWDEDAWRIGYGTAVPGIGPASTTTPEQARLWLGETLDTLAAEITGQLRVPVAQYQFDALGSFVYNIGIGRFMHSTMLRLLNEGKYDEAANEFPRWVYVRNPSGEPVISSDLQKRRELEQSIFLGKGAPGYEYPVGG